MIKAGPWHMGCDQTQLCMGMAGDVSGAAEGRPPLCLGKPLLRGCA